MATSTTVPEKQTSTALGGFAWGVVGYNILVILWGAVVRATGSGAGCGDRWPLCNGDFFPHHPRLATVIEFAHRSMTGVCVFWWWPLWDGCSLPQRKGHRARKAAVASVVLLVTEAILGAVLVLGGYVEHNLSTARVVMQSVHFTNTMLLLAALSLTAWWVGNPKWLEIPSSSKKPSVWAAWTALGATIVVGATGALAALADTLFPSPSLQAALASDFAATSPLLVRMRWMHPAAAVLGFCCVIWLVLGARSRLSRLVAAFLGLQVVLGVADVLLLAPTWMQITHLLGADLYWIVLVGFAAGTIWPNDRPVRSA